MAVTADRVIVELEAKLDRYTANVAQAEKRFTDATKKIQSSAAGAESAATGAFRNIARAAAGLSVIALARGLLSIADEAKNLNAQLKLATSQTGSFGQATADVRRIAEETRSGLTATAQLYGNFQRNAKDLGITQAEAARATETFSKTLLISGAGAAESSAAIRQFSQALASGVLRGDEFNSIMENSPRLARLLADSLGVPIGALRAMAEEGTLTADKLTAALTDRQFTAGIDAEFKELPVTFGQAMEQVKNAAVITFGAFDRGGEFSEALANFIMQGTDGFAQMEADAENTGIEIRAAFEALANVFGPMIAGAKEAFSIIGSDAITLRGTIAGLFGAYDTIKNRLNLVRPEGDFSLAAMAFPGLRAQKSNTRGQFEAAYDAAASELEGKRDARAVRSMWEGHGDGAGGGSPTRLAGKTKGGRKKTGPSAETLARRAEAEAQAAERRQQAFDNDLARLNADLVAARSALVKSAELQEQFERQEIELAQTKYNDNLASQVTQKKLTQAQADQLRAVNDQIVIEKLKGVDLQREQRLIQERADAREAALDLATTDIGIARDLASAQGQLANTAAERRAVELRILDLAYDEERLRLEAIRDMEASSDPAEEARREAQREAARRRLAAMPAQYAADRAGVEKANAGPLGQYIAGMADVATQIEQVQVNALNALSDSLANAATKALGLSGALGDIVGQLVQIGIQRAIIGPLADAMFGAQGGGGGFLGSLISSVVGGPTKRASGGHVSAGQIYQINEGGVEGFQPAGSGKIIPLGKMRGAGGGGGTVVQQTFVLDARYGITTPELLRHVNQVASSKATQAGAASFDASQKAMPGRLDRLNKLGT